MILSENGQYYFDDKMVEEYKIDLHYKILENFYGYKQKNNIFSYSYKVNNIQFLFSKKSGFIEVSSDKNNIINILINFPIKLYIELFENKKIEMDVFSKEQFNQNLKFYKVEFPIVNSLILTKQLEKFIDAFMNANLIIPAEVDPSVNLEGLTDSKKLSEKKRDYFFEEIKKQAISYGIGIVDEKRIDEINIYEATKEAMVQAINNCTIKTDYVLTDAMKLDLDIPVKPLIKGDLRSITISAASVLAKVTRDRMLYELDKKYPMYDFKNNVGYPTKKHLEAIDKYGIIKEHRKSYGPVKDYLEKNS